MNFKICTKLKHFVNQPNIGLFFWSEEMKKYFFVFLFIGAISTSFAQTTDSPDPSESESSKSAGTSPEIRSGLELKEGYKGEGKFIFMNGREGGPDKVFFQDSSNRLELVLSPCLNEIINLDGLEEKNFAVKGLRIWNGSVWDLRVDSFEERKAGQSVSAASETKKIGNKPSVSKKQKPKKTNKLIPKIQ